MRADLRVIGLAALAVFLPLAASGNASAARLNYTSQTATDVNMSYFDLPASTEIVFLNQISGGIIATPVPLLSGSGSLAIPFSVLPLPHGQYYVLARQAGFWVAQTVMFYD